MSLAREAPCSREARLARAGSVDQRHRELSALMDSQDEYNLGPGIDYTHY